MDWQLFELTDGQILRISNYVYEGGNRNMDGIE